MNAAAMSSCIASLKVGDFVWVRYAGGGPNGTRYRVAKIKGKKARELELLGDRGAERRLIDGGDKIWLRDPTAAKRRFSSESGGYRRVTSVSLDADARTPANLPARARLPDGYDVAVLGPLGFVAMITDPCVGGRLNAPTQGPIRASPWEAAIDAWEHHSRTAETARMRLPDSYQIARTQGGFVATLCGDEVAPERSSTLDAVFDAWEHEVRGWAAEALKNADDLAEARRSQVALAQIYNALFGLAPGEQPLPSTLDPSRVVIETLARLIVAP